MQLKSLCVALIVFAVICMNLQFLSLVNSVEVSFATTPVACQNTTISSSFQEASPSKTRSPSKLTTVYASAAWIDEVGHLIPSSAWSIRAKDQPLPCVPPQRLNWLNEFDPRARDPSRRAQEQGERQSIHSLTAGQPGMFMIKPMKVGGSTLAGVHMRILHEQGQRASTPLVCRGNFRHANALQYSSIHEKSVFWSVLRDPTARAISQFFHFSVSREKVEPTDVNFQDFLQPRSTGVGPFWSYYIKTLWFDEEVMRNPSRVSPSRQLQEIQERPGKKRKAVDLESVSKILPMYDFVAITERMDESMVVLKHLWDLPWGDVLSLSAKENGGYDAGGSANGCTWIVPSFVSEGMQAYFASKEWLEQIYWDYALYAAANASLDRTIEEVIGREIFDRDLQHYRHYQSVVAQECGPVAIFPCSRAGEKQTQTNCLWMDSACANDCVDSIAERIENGLI